MEIYWYFIFGIVIFISPWIIVWINPIDLCIWLYRGSKIRPLSSAQFNLFLETKFQLKIITNLSPRDALHLVFDWKNRNLLGIDIDDRYKFEVGEKHPNFKMYKILCKSNIHANNHAVYLLGNDAHTNDIFMLRCPPSLIFAPIEKCRKWCLNVPEDAEIMEV